MGGFTVGLVAGCLLGVCGTFLMLSLAAALSAERARVFHLRSLPATLLSIAALLLIALTCRRLGIGKDASTLLLLLAVLCVSRLEGLLSGLIATAVAALILVFSFFPPVGTILIRSSSDRLALALFLLIATLGSRLIGKREEGSTS